MPTCPKCGTELDRNAKFCFECGEPIPQNKKCIHCGFELPSTAKFCTNCGKEQSVIAKSSKHLQNLIQDAIKKFGPNCNLNFINVSQIKDMNLLFWNSEFNGDISKWDVSNVTNMSGMFAGSQFNGDISNWDVSKVTNMNSMFIQSQFNGDISKWDVSNVVNMMVMFSQSQFNGDISNWNVANVIYMSEMFDDSKFKGYIGKWKLNEKADTSFMFGKGPIAQCNIDWYKKKKYKVLENAKKIFTNTHDLRQLIAATVEIYGYSCDLNFINVSKITDMGALFSGYLSQFNGDISKWDVSNVQGMACMFSSSQFNGDISKWDVSKVQNMSMMFYGSQFNGDISNWDVSKVQNMSRMFNESQFNGDISNWNVSKVSNMKDMFSNSALEKTSNIPSWFDSNINEEEYYKFNPDSDVCEF